MPSWDNFVRCGKETIYRTCFDCGATKKIKYQCKLKWCPVCSSWLSWMRRRKIQAWSSGIKQPKHVVLTQRNTEHLTGRQWRKFTKALVSLRRAKVFRDVRGGCATLEVTNERKGWHLHAHLLLDVNWIDAGDLARAWAKRVEQSFAIVKIKDVRQAEYLQEVSKYVVKGSELAAWLPDEIHTFIWTMHRRRTFFTFGSLNGFQPPAVERRPVVCECGCDKFRFETLLQSILREIRLKI